MVSRMTSAFPVPVFSDSPPACCRLSIPSTFRRCRPKDQPEMIRTVRSYLRSTQCRPDMARSCFQHEDVQYAAG